MIRVAKATAAALTVVGLAFALWRVRSVLHPVATYGHKAGEVVVAIFFTLAATWLLRLGA